MSAPAPEAKPHHAELDRLRVWQRFHIAITALYGGPIFLVLTAMCGYFYVRGVNIEMGALQSRLHGMSTSLAGTTDPSIFEGAPTEARGADLLAKISKISAAEPDIVSIYAVRRSPNPDELQFVVDWVREDDPAAPGEMYDVTQAPVMAEAFDGPRVEDELYADQWGPSLSGYAPVYRDGVAVGVIGIDLAAERVYAIKREVIATTLIVYVAASLILVALARIVGTNIREPLVRIIGATQAIHEGKLDVRADLDRPDEFGILGRHFDGMAVGLQEREHIRDTFGRYMSERLAKRLLGSPDATQLGGEELHVTVLFSDLRSYSTISETLSPTQVVALLNDYMGEMGQIVDDHHGVVIEFLGDAVLAVFGAIDPDPDHARHAVDCALAMQQRLDVLNAKWQKSGVADLWTRAGIARLRARIGVHTGTVIAGNMGGYRRMKYAVIGDPVTVATKVESLNNVTETDVLITAETRAELDSSYVARTTTRGQYPVKGRAAAIEVFSIGEAT